MTGYTGLKLGAVLLVLMAVLLFSGCTEQGVGVSPPTATPTPAGAASPVPDSGASKVMAGTLAAMFAAEIDGDTLAAALAEGPDSAAFATLLGQLTAFRAADSRIANVYTLVQQGGTVRYIVDASTGQPGGSAFLEEFSGAPAALKVPFTAPFAVGPTRGAQGTYITGFAPVESGGHGTLILAVDIRA